MPPTGSGANLAGRPAWLPQRAEDLRRIYYVVGADGVFLGEARGSLTRAVLPDASDFNFDRFDAGALVREAFFSAVRQLPVFAERRLVVVTGFEEASAELREAVVAYAEAPVATTVLGLFARKGERGDFAKRISANGVVVSCDPPSARELPTWLKRRAAARGVDVAPDAATLLADLIGVDVGLLDNAVEQLSLFANGARITVEHVEELVVATRSRTVFELVDAIGSGRSDVAASIVAKLLAQREAPPMILGMLARHARQLLIARETLAARGGTSSSLASVLKVPPFVATNIAKQAGRMDERALVTIVDELWKTDRALKSSVVDPDLVLERAVVELTRRVSGR